MFLTYSGIDQANLHLDVCKVSFDECVAFVRFDIYKTFGASAYDAPPVLDLWIVLICLYRYHQANLGFRSAQYARPFTILV